METDLLRELLISEESLRFKKYKDTKDIWTIAVGRNMEANPLPPEMQAKVDADEPLTYEDCMALLEEDIERVLAEVQNAFDWFGEISDVRKTVICNMVFNMGLHRVSNFKHMIAAIEDGDFKTAAAEMLNSDWANQVGDRAVVLAHLMETDSA